MSLTDTLHAALSLLDGLEDVLDITCYSPGVGNEGISLCNIPLSTLVEIAQRTGEPLREYHSTNDQDTHYSVHGKYLGVPFYASLILADEPVTA